MGLGCKAKPQHTSLLPADGQNYLQCFSLELGNPGPSKAVGHLEMGFIGGSTLVIRRFLSLMFFPHEVSNRANDWPPEMANIYKDYKHI